MPNTSQPRARAPRVTARTAAFMPGASPPLVRTAIFFKLVILIVDDPEGASPRGQKVPGLPAVGQRDADGVRRRRPACPRDAGRRAARGRGRQAGPALRRPGGET